MTQTAIGNEQAPLTHGYRAVWRWHFLAGLWIAPLLIALTLSGAIYLFDREIDGWWNRGIQTVIPQGRPLSLEEQEAAVLAAFPGASPLQVRLPRSDDEASIWGIKAARGTNRDVYLDPYRGRVNGTTDPDMQPTAIVRRLHATFLGGKVGGYVVELVACWTLIMMTTGIWLWWPRKWKAKGVFVPRWKTTGRRYWRDLHSIPSIFNALFAILLVLTGLPWSAFWGEQFAKLGQVAPFVAPSPNFKAPPRADGSNEADMHTAHRTAAMDSPGAARIPWTIKHTQVPHGSGPGPVGIGEMERLLSKLARSRFGEGVRIFYPKGTDGVFMISYVPDKAEGQRTLYIDPGTGRLLGNIGWADYSPAAKAVEWGVMTHMGREYGLPNQLVNLAVCLVLMGAIVAGLTLWWKRRPRGQLAAPRLLESDIVPLGVKATLGAIAVLFPLAGLSMIPIILWTGWRRPRRKPKRHQRWAGG